jgi:hypothetical protein
MDDSADGRDDESVVPILLAEYAALRAEVVARLNSQATTFGVTLTAVGVVAGIVLTGKASRELLLVIPVLAPSLGLFFIDHMRHMALLGLYIRGDLWEVLRRELAGRPLPSWEHRWAAYNDMSQHRKLSSYLLFALVVVVPPGAVFFLSSVICLVFTASQAFDTTPYAVVWVLGCVLTVLVPFAAALVSPQYRQTSLSQVLEDTAPG